MNNRRLWFRLGGVLAAAAVCTGGAAVVPADDEVCRERYPTFETARQAADSIDDQAYIKEARFA